MCNKMEALIVAELKKSISVKKGIILAVSMVIGSGLMGLPGITLQKANVYEVMSGWFITIAAVLPLIYIFAKLGSLFPSAAGLAKYAEVAFGKRGRYLATYILIGTFIIGLPGIALIGGDFIRRVFCQSENMINFYAMIILVAAAIQNILSQRITHLINTISVIVLSLILTLLIILNFNYVYEGIKVTAGINFENIKLIKLWNVSALIFWAFLGWENLSFGLEEFKDPEKSIPKVYFGSFFIVVVFYLLLALASAGAKHNGIAIEGASGLSLLFKGEIFSKFITAAMGAVIAANCGAWAFGASRLLFSAGREEIVPKKFGVLDKKGNPIFSVLILAATYFIILLICYIFNIGVDILMMLVNQNFIVLYGMSISAYFGITKGKKKFLITSLSVAALLFFISGFTYMMIYPIILGSAGIIAGKKVENANRKGE